MVRHLFRCAAFALATVAGVALQAQDGDEIERTGKHFRIVFHRGELPGGIAGPLTEQALAKVEGLWPILQKLVGARGSKKHTIHLYRDEKEYRSAEKSSSPARFLLEGFTTKELEGHVWLWPELIADLFAHTGLPPSTVENLLRVAAEQIITPLVPATDTEDWMRWVLVMGAVEAATNPEHEPGVNPAHDARRVVVVDKRRAGESFSLESLLNPALKFRRRSDYDWAMSCSAILAQGLARANSRWAKKLLGKHRLPRGPVDELVRRRAAVAAVVGKNWSKAEIRFAEVLRGIDPVWNTRTPLWMPSTTRSLLAGTKDHTASAYAVRPPPAGPYAISGRVELLGVDQAFRVPFGWDGSSVVTALFFTNQVLLAVWDSDKREWIDKARMFAKDREQGWGNPFDFRVEVTESRVRVLIDGSLQFAWHHEGREVHDSWGLEMNQGIAWLENLRIEPLPPAVKK